MNWTIRDLQQQIEESLSNLPEIAIPEELEGLRNLPVSGFRPRVSIYYTAAGGKRRKVREDANAGYFDPEACELVIGFEPLPDPEPGDAGLEVMPGTSNESSDEFDIESAMDQLLHALRVAESMRRFIGLKWFRDQFLPNKPDFEWARDRDTIGMLLGRGIDDGLILTYKVPNPNSPFHPTTAIRLNRRSYKFTNESREGMSRFRPIRVPGVSLSEAVLRDREDARY